MAETERKARQAAETQKAKAADLLAKRATDMADRLTAGGGGGSSGSGRSTGTSTPATVATERRQASLPVEMPTHIDQGDDEVLSGGDPANDPSTPATELLLKRIQELVERAQQAEEQLQIEQCFSKLHKEACEEKKDQLAERVSHILLLNCT